MCELGARRNGFADACGAIFGYVSYFCITVEIQPGNNGNDIQKWHYEVINIIIQNIISSNKVVAVDIIPSGE